MNVAAGKWGRGGKAAESDASAGDFLSRVPAMLGRRSPSGNASQDLAETLLLVRNFEESRQGWFWSTDRDGKLTYLSDTVREFLRNGQEALIGADFADLFEVMKDGSDTGRTLPFVLLKRTRFEKLALRAAGSLEERWWSVSGCPQYDQTGEFSGFRGSAIDITEQLKSSEYASQLAKYDSLTGLSNRRRMAEVLEANLAASNHHGRPCAILMIDLDRFKQVNDTLGHPAGDALLNQVAERLLRIIGDRENVSRLGGDEFQIIVADCEDRKRLGEIATRIIASLAQPYSVAGSRCVIGASIGIAIAPADGRTRDELIRNADLALYASKAGGRGRFSFFSSQLLRVAEDKRLLEEDLRDALARDEIELAYQPIVDARTNRATGVEALIRWNHPVRGPISPTIFVPIAEEADLIRPLGEWVLRKACQDAASWPGKLRVAVNVSPVQFTHDSLPKIVLSALAASGLAPERLELEITEGVFLDDCPQTDAMFSTLKQIGVRLALDDFGTGYSSLGYLKKAPFDKIKIDQSFVRAATLPGSRNRAIIAAIVALADALEMETTAEGIESLDQLQLVRNLGATHVQGYVYSEAVRSEVLSRKIENGEWILPPSGPTRQRSDRQAMFRKASAISASGHQPILIRNISESGALVEGLDEIPVGDLLAINFGNGELAFGRVRRSSGQRHGISFHEPLMLDGDNSLRTGNRFSAYALAKAGLPTDTQLDMFRTGEGALPITPEELAARLGLEIGACAAAPANEDGPMEQRAAATDRRNEARPPTLRELSIRYLDQLKDDRPRQEIDDRHLRQHILPRFGHLRRDQIADQDVDGWLTAKANDENCPPEIVARLQAILDHLGMSAQDAEDDAAEAEGRPSQAALKSAYAHVATLTDREAARLIDAIKASHNRQLRYIVALLVLTGARQRDLLQAQWSDLDLDLGIWTLPPSRSGQIREIKVPEAAIASIRDMPRSEGALHLFVNAKTQQPYRSLTRSWETIRCKAGLPDLEIDDLRLCIGDGAAWAGDLLKAEEGIEAGASPGCPAAASSDHDVEPDVADPAEAWGMAEVGFQPLNGLSDIGMNDAAMKT
ncbi:EAL domain-containing protein [Sphingosinicella rhizophila]|uniref:EAL domain-containing protein n=1 Tax=Sphingosinicella rhizophila TaxID=3050082 RepID=A0ABU3Q9K5_9SPHN|nr:EAL domain-containing protein [Sphingosinicella sp. GR2756]MDT9600086.1 EAL domain-containing protein [Sphingosinicella sp. GR2756]